MTQFDKLIARIRAQPPDAEFRDVRRLMEAYGWNVTHIRGSHVRFDKSGERSIIVPTIRGRKVKRAYLRRIIEGLGLDD